METEFITRLNHIMSIEPEERSRPKKFVMSKKNRKRLEMMNNIIEKHIDVAPATDITHLNAIHYAAAITLAGEEEEKVPGKSRPNPDRFIDENIEKTRKSIGKLTAAKNSGKIKPDIKKFLEKTSIDTALQRKKMKLAALCKKKKNRIAARSRREANRMYANSKKNFFSKLRSEETSPLIEPPTRDEIKKFWGGIYEDKKEHNSKAEWIKKEKERMTDVMELQ